MCGLVASRRQRTLAYRRCKKKLHPQLLLYTGGFVRSPSLSFRPSDDIDTKSFPMPIVSGHFELDINSALAAPFILSAVKPAWAMRLIIERLIHL